MLSLSDAALARRDPDVPGLSTLLDPEVLQERLGSLLLPESTGRVRTVYLRYKARTSCVAAYKLHEGGPVVLHVIARRTDAGDKLRQARQRVLARDGSAATSRLLEELALEVVPFPFDSQLRSLARFADPETRAALLRQRFPQMPGLWTAELSALAYKPERRFVAQLLAPTGERAVLRLYTEPGFEAARTAARAFRSHGSLRVASWLGRSVRHRALLLEWLPGRTAYEMTRRGADQQGAAALEAAGSALAVLHAQPGVGLPVRGRAEVSNSLGRAAAAVAEVCPDLSRSVHRLADRLAARLSEFPEVGRAIHGDFHPQQVLIDGARASILDLDRAALGDPAADLGLFLAHLERDELHGQVAEGAVDTFGEALRRGYEREGGRAVGSRIEAHRAAGLLLLAIDPFRYRQDDWPGRVEQLVKHAEQRLVLASQASIQG